MLVFLYGIDFDVLMLGGDKEQATKPSRLLDGSSEFVLTYEDKDGDWMLVGDVPWRYAADSDTGFVEKKFKETHPTKMC